MNLIDIDVQYIYLLEYHNLTIYYNHLLEIAIYNYS